MTTTPKPSPGDPVYLTVVVTRTHREFENYCREMNLNPRSKLLISECDEGRGGMRLRGIDGRKADVVFAGTYWERRDIADVRDTLRAGRFADADR
jgi:hypothetical protein